MVIGEFMCSALYPSGSSLQPIRMALNNNSITGHSNLMALLDSELRKISRSWAVATGPSWLCVGP